MRRYLYGAATFFIFAAALVVTANPERSRAGAPPKPVAVVHCPGRRRPFEAYFYKNDKNMVLGTPDPATLYKK
jgi:hypothetical protein